MFKRHNIKTYLTFLNPLGVWLWGFFIFLPSKSSAQLNSINIFGPGEKVTYEISYNWGFIWVNAGWVTFSVKDSSINNQQLLHLEGKGATYPKYDWIYRVNDYYHSVVDQNLKPYFFERKVEEGKTRIHNKYYFNAKDEKIISSMSKQNLDPIIDTLPFNDGVVDILSIIYVARTLDFSNFPHGKKIPIQFILDGKIHDSYVRYLGKEIKEVKNLGKVLCYVFSPLLIEGTIFNEGEDMTVWVTADEQKIPVMVETPILVGMIKAYLSSYSGTRQEIKIID